MSLFSLCSILCPCVFLSACIHWLHTAPFAISLTSLSSSIPSHLGELLLPHSLHRESTCNTVGSVHQSQLSILGSPTSWWMFYNCIHKGHSLWCTVLWILINAVIYLPTQNHTEQFHHPKNSSMNSLCSQPLASVFYPRGVAFFRVSCKWNHITCSLCSLASFT